MSIPEGYAMLPVNHPPVQSTIILQQAPARPPVYRSSGIIGLGVLLLVIGIGCIGIGAFAYTKIGNYNFLLALLACGGSAVIAGFLAICGGNDVYQRGTSIAFSCVGAAVASVAAGATIYFIHPIFTDKIEEGKVCLSCHGKLIADNFSLEHITKMFNIVKGELEGECDIFCNETAYRIIAGLAGGCTIVSLMLLCISCCIRKRPPYNV